MKTYQIILSVIALFLVNNLALLSFTGYFSERETPVTEHKTVSSNNEPEPTSIATASSSPTAPETSEAELVQALENYIRDEKFALAMDDWQFKSRQRNKKMKERLAKMSGQELHTLALETNSRTERATAYNQLLRSGKFNQLSNHELKNLYTEIDYDHWGKTTLLSALLTNGDTEAVEWAKQSITENKLSRYSGSDVYDVIYGKDPDFIRRHITNIDLEDSINSNGLLSFIQHEPALEKLFISRNIDEILNSENDSIFAKGFHNASVDLNLQQQSKVLTLMESNNSHKRNFAIALARNIDDTHSLRESYAKLTRTADKNHFIHSLFNSKPDTDNTALARELAENSDDPNIRMLLNLYNTN